MTQKRPPSDQLTLFQCIRQDTSEDQSNKRHCHGTESNASVASQDSEKPAACGESNYINIQSPSGPTTVIVNQASASQELCTGSCTERQTLEVPDDIAASPAHPPVRPVNIKFPSTLFSGKARSFSPRWYHSYPWLEYSVSQDACFCYPCHLFGVSSGGLSRPEMAFTTIGFSMQLVKVVF